MAKKRKRSEAEQYAFDERTKAIDHRIGARSEATEQKISALLTGTFDERTTMIRDFITRHAERIAAEKAAGQTG